MAPVVEPIMTPPPNAAAVNTVGVALLTLNSRHHLERCLAPILASRVATRVLVVDSSSTDGTVEAARSMGAETLVIPREQFNHGSTREMARHQLATDIAAYFTPDAY